MARSSPLYAHAKELLGGDCVVLYDLEYTSWEGSLQRRWSEPWEHREVVQIAAVRFNPTTCAVTQTFEVLTLPVRNPQLSRYFQDLTGIDQAQLDARAIAFESAYGHWCRFVADATAYSWGNDSEVFSETLEIQGLEPGPVPKVANLIDVFVAAGLEVTGVSSGQLAHHLGSTRSFRAHNALDDCLSLAAALELLDRRARELGSEPDTSCRARGS